MKNKWENYALKDGKVQSSYIREYSSRSPKRQAREASRCNRLLEGREDPREAKEEIKFRGNDEEARLQLPTEREPRREV